MYACERGNGLFFCGFFSVFVEEVLVGWIFETKHGENGQCQQR